MLTASPAAATPRTALAWIALLLLLLLLLLSGHAVWRDVEVGYRSLSGRSRVIHHPLLFNETQRLQQIAHMITQ